MEYGTLTGTRLLPQCRLRIKRHTIQGMLQSPHEDGVLLEVDLVLPIPLAKQAQAQGKQYRPDLFALHKRAAIRLATF